MIIGIEASNIREGGALIYLYELLNHADPQRDMFTKIIVWSNKTTLEFLPDKDFIVKKHIKLLDKKLAFRFLWQNVLVTQYAKKEKIDLLFVPGGSYLGSFRPFVPVSQSMLPFDDAALKLYKGTAAYYKNKFRKHVLLRSFKNASGVIFVSQAMKDTVYKYLKKPHKNDTVIHHGVSDIFYRETVPEKTDDKIRLLCVSYLLPHKNIDSLVEAVMKLYNEGKDIELKIIGGYDSPYAKKTLNLIDKLDPERKVIKLLGKINYFDMPKYYFESDALVFPSLCESFGMPLMEAKNALIPILCSRIDSFVEVMGNGDFYCEDKYLKNKIIEFSESKNKQNIRKHNSWNKSSTEHFKFFKQTKDLNSL
ncbi:MAG: glycosyltransferase [Melioribacteraceae bacterium]|nr:glycosyltransferase [Melioribacteraceae bacterium]